MELSDQSLAIPQRYSIELDIKQSICRAHQHRHLFAGNADIARKLFVIDVDLSLIHI